MGAAAKPLGVQAGRIRETGNQPFSASIETGRHVRPNDSSTPRCTVGAGLTALFPEPERAILMTGKLGDRIHLERPVLSAKPAAPRQTSTTRRS